MQRSNLINHKSSLVLALILISMAAAFAGGAAIALLRYGCVLARLLHKHQLWD